MEILIAVNLEKIKKMGNIPELDTKFLKVLTTKDQREIIRPMIDLVMDEEEVKEGRALELICLDFKAGYYPKKPWNKKKINTIATTVEKK
jgi:hypothetical protein